MAQKYATTEDPTIRMALKLKAEAADIRRFREGDIWRPIDGASQREVADVLLSMRSSASSESKTSVGWQLLPRPICPDVPVGQPSGLENPLVSSFPALRELGPF